MPLTISYPPHQNRHSIPSRGNFMLLESLAFGFRANSPADAVAGRYAVDYDRALHRMQQAGAIITTAESAVFEWVGAAGTPQFKEISKLVQERMKEMKNEE